MCGACRADFDALVARRHQLSDDIATALVELNEVSEKIDEVLGGDLHRAAVEQ